MGDSGTPSAFTKPDTPTYPPLPGIFNVPWSLDEVWAKAWIHQVLIRAYLLGIDGYIHPPELTTGSDVYDITTHDAEHCTICLPLVGPLFHWTEPCSCEYALHPTTWYPTHRIDVPGVGMRGAAYTIRIDPDCPHHGDDLLYPDGGVWGFTLADTVLDDDERRGH